MRKQFRPFIMLLLVTTTILTSGCSKLSREAKCAGAAILTGITASVAYMGNAFGIKKRKRKKPAVAKESTTAKTEGSAK